MEKLREIFIFACFVFGIVSLILSILQAWKSKIKAASTLGIVFALCGVFLFLPQIKAFKVWDLQVDLRETLDRAEEIIGRVRKLSSISARASYLTIAWGNRLGTPPAKEKQAVLDEIDGQLAELKVAPAELADIQRPFVKMVRLDFFFLFQGVLRQYATIQNEVLVTHIRETNDPSTVTAFEIRHSELITAWTRRTERDEPSTVLESKTLEEALDSYIPKSGEWLSDKELAVVRKFKEEIVRLNADCEKKGGYTPEAAAYYDRYSGDHIVDKATQLSNEALQ